MLIEELKKRGYRATPQRDIILQAIETLPGHITAEEIFEQVQQTSLYISLATVYRTLELLKALGLIAESDMGTTTSTYALKAHGPHHHAVCRKCGKSIELPHELFEPLVAELQAAYSFTADANHLTVFGWCEACKAGENVD